jgi:hypothetical protein
VSVAELFVRRASDGEPELVARIRTPESGGAAVVEAVPPGTRAGVETLLSIGVPGPGGRTLHLRDGEAFVRALPQGFRGSHVFAVLV